LAKSTFLAVALGMIAGSASAQFALHDGDRVLFYGDSITDQKLYTAFVETYVVTRFPRLNVEFRACGVGGDSTWGGWTGDLDTRMRRDVAPFKPNVVTVLLGMNDAGYTVPLDPKILAVFKEWYGKLLVQLDKAAPGARVTLMRSPPYDDTAHPHSDFPGYGAVVRGFGDYVKTLAEEKHLGYVDMNIPVDNFVKAVLAADPKHASEMIPDAIHPSPHAHIVMAAQILEAWNAPSVVSDVSVDASSKSISRHAGTAVSGFDGMEWSQSDTCLPFPFDAGTAFGQRYSDFDQKLNREMLTVTGLEPGNYRLTIDKLKICDLPASAWAAGVNLAPLDTPMHRQAHDVLDLVNKRNDADYTNWFRVGFGFEGYKTSPEVEAALVKLEREIHADERKTAIPKEHHYKLEKI
jgi:lysophospholipase L1-like esterase